MKKLLALILAFAMVFSLGATAAAADSEAERAADALYAMGLFQGKGTDIDGKPIYALEDAPPATRQ